MQPAIDPTGAGIPAARPRRRRRWLQYSLRTLVVVMTVCGIWLGLIAHRAAKQRRAVELVQRLRGSVQYSYQRAGSSRFGPTWLRELIGGEYFDSVVAVDLERSRVTDADLRILGGLDALGSLNLRRTPVTDAGLQNLNGLDNLRRLELDGCNISDAGIMHLSQLRGLKQLSVVGTRVSRAGLTRLLRHLGRLQVRCLLGVELHAVGEDGQRFNRVPAAQRFRIEGSYRVLDAAKHDHMYIRINVEIRGRGADGVRFVNVATVNPEPDGDNRFKFGWSGGKPLDSPRTCDIRAECLDVCIASSDPQWHPGRREREW